MPDMVNQYKEAHEASRPWARGRIIGGQVRGPLRDRLCGSYGKDLGFLILVWYEAINRVQQDLIYT